MKKFLYVAALVGKVDAETVTLHHSIIETVFGVPSPDVIPTAHSSMIRFRHAFIEAESIDDAYLLGWGEVGPMPEYKTMNDYVIELP